VTGEGPDIAFMRRAIAVARPRLGLTRPNPAVGCVLVRDGAVLAEAATGEGGRPHAEEQALAAAGEAARGATAYVTLEPCGFRSSGAPSCADRLLSAQVARVRVACDDPTDLAAGQGVARLRAAGVDVEIGLLAAEAFFLCEGFLHRVRTGRPLLGASLDGQGFEAPLTLRPGETVEAALDRMGAEGFTRVWTPPAPQGPAS
jgi:diaminohydroxyphosphoribosylaminopyrimidine deaminase/5-amino-6-(5-phosphoribosylamino)uracil reductase